MRLRLGRAGETGAVAAAASALFFCGVFSVEGTDAYQNNIPVYLALPLSLLLSLMPVLFIGLAMKRTGESSLTNLASFALGRVPAAFVLLPLCAAALLAASEPLVSCAQVLHKLVYDGAAYSAVLAFVFPALAFAALKGFACLTRVQLVFLVPLAASVLLAVSAAVPGFSISRLHPFPGCTAKVFLLFTLRGSSFFMPVFTSLFICAPAFAVGGAASKTAVRAALFALPAVFAVLLAIRLCYPSSMLSGLAMPLYRIGLMQPAPGFILRLDKLMIMLWLTGSLIAAALLIYSAALMFTLSFSMRDVTPAVVCFTSLTLFAVVFAVEGGESAAHAVRLLFNYGFLISAVPLTLISAAALIKRRSA